MIMKLTLDTNCFFEYYERNPALIQELINFQEEGYIEIAVTTRVMADTNDKSKGEGISQIWANVQSFPMLEIIGTAFRLDISRLDSGDYLISDDDVNLMGSLRRTMADAQMEDIDHLFGHIKAKRDIFVTSNNHFLDYQESLLLDFGTVVLPPYDTVQRIRKSISQEHDTL
jgi:hypothetical protein